MRFRSSVRRRRARHRTAERVARVMIRKLRVADHDQATYTLSFFQRQHFNPLDRTMAHSSLLEQRLRRLESTVLARLSEAGITATSSSIAHVGVINAIGSERRLRKCRLTFVRA